MKTSRMIVTIVFLLLLVIILYTCGCTSNPEKAQPVPPVTTSMAPEIPAPITTTPSTPVQLPSADAPKITITSPKDGSVVDYRTTIKGMSTGVYGTPLNLYIIIQPQESGDDYWVQPEIILQDNGDWSTLAYFGGDATSKYKDKKFTVYAVLSTSKLNEGETTQKPSGIKQMIELTRG
jgi:hypothetical protein